MRDPITGEHPANITCPKCRFRHPALWTCEYSASIAQAERAERERLNAEASASDSCKHDVPYRYECGECLDELHRPAARTVKVDEPSPFDDAPPAHRLNGDLTVAVSTEVFWNTDMAACPRGVKVQLDTQGGCALYGIYDGKDPFYVGWAPVPRRRQT